MENIELRKELEDLEKLYEGFLQTAEMQAKETALKWFDCHFHDKKSEEEALKQVAHWEANVGTYKDILWRIKRVLGKEYLWIKEGWYCPGCRPGKGSGGLYG